MESKLLLILAVEVGTITMSIIGATALWEMANDPQITTSIQNVAQVAGILISLCCAVAVISLIRTLSRACLPQIRLLRVRRMNNQRYEESNKLFLKAGLDPTDFTRQ